MKSLKTSFKRGALALGMTLAAYAPSLFGQTSTASAAVATMGSYVPFDNSTLARIEVGQSQWGNTRYQNLNVLYNNQNVPVSLRVSETPGKPNELVLYSKIKDVKVLGTHWELLGGAGLSADHTTFKKGKMDNANLGVVGKVGVVTSRSLKDTRNSLAAKLFMAGKIGQEYPTFEAEVSGKTDKYVGSANVFVNPNQSHVFTLMVGRKINEGTTVSIGFERAKFADGKYSNGARIQFGYDLKTLFGHKKVVNTKGL